MPKKFVGLVTAVVLALTGQSLATLPAAAEPQYVLPAQKPDKPADKAKAGKAKAKAKAKVADAVRETAARNRNAYLVNSGPKAVEATRAAARAQAAYTARQRSADAWVKRTAALARASSTAQTRAAALPAKSKREKAAKKSAEAVAAKARKAYLDSAARARQEVTAAAKAKRAADNLRQEADEARAIYAGLAGARADLATRQAATARKKAVAATRAVGPLQLKSSAAVKAAGTARATYRAAKAAAATAAARATPSAIKRAKLSAKAAKKAKSAARAAARLEKRTAEAARAADKAAARTAGRYREAAAVSGRSRALATQLSVAAAQAKKAAGPNVSWNPTDSVLFNHPRGTRAEKYALITQLNRAIDATPAGGDIRIAMYLFDIGSVADKLIAAHRRGVNVQILLDDNTTNKWIKKVKNALGTNRAARSFFGVCDHSCMSTGTSTIHAKFYLFSVAGQSKYVSLVSSGNPYSGNTTKSWNNTHTIVKNKTIYDSLNQYFTDMLPDRNNDNYYRTTQSGKYTVYYYPQRLTKSDDLVWMHHLNRVSCKAAKGYGNAQGRTLIRVANWGWTTPRIDVAQRLWKLHDSGCAVQVMVNSGRISRSVLKVLLRKSSRYGRMPVYNAWRDWRKRDVAGLYVHHKFATISGTLNGKNAKLTLTGSQNFTALGTTANNDLVLRVIDPKVLEQYNTNFAYIRDNYTKRMTSVPLVTRKPDRQGGV